MKTVCSAPQVFVVHTVFPPLQALHITVGLLNIGLGAIIEVRSSPYPFWLGGMVSKHFLMIFFPYKMFIYMFPSLPQTRVGAAQLISNKCSHTGHSGHTQLTLK